jgi:hypothetical protein
MEPTNKQKQEQEEGGCANCSVTMEFYACVVPLQTAPLQQHMGMSPKRNCHTHTHAHTCTRHTRGSQSYGLHIHEPLEHADLGTHPIEPADSVVVVPQLPSVHKAQVVPLVVQNPDVGATGNAVEFRDGYAQTFPRGSALTHCSCASSFGSAH